MPLLHSPPVPVLILGGTTEASTLCTLLEYQNNFAPTLSLAGVTRNPHMPALSVRTGGFGGVDGLCDWLRHNKIQAVVNAVHPFAAVMSQHVSIACEKLSLPLLRLKRPGWKATPADTWHHAPDLNKAAMVLAEITQPLQIFLTTGRKETRPFKNAPQHHYILRSIEAPLPADLPPHTTLITARGPFDLAGEYDMLRRHQINWLVTKNSGGKATFAKIEAARQLNIPVLIIDRPAQPAGPCVHTAQEALSWLQNYSATTLRNV